MPRFLVVFFILLCVQINSLLAEKLVLDGSTTVGPIAKAFAEYFMEMYPDLNILVSESGSGNGVKSLIHGTCDIAIMSRFMKIKEYKAALENGVLPVPHVIAMDEIAIVVHPGNPVQNLTVMQVRDIYQGKITNWKEVGGPDERIVLISRDTNSGTYETFYELVMSYTDDKQNQVREKIISTAEYVGSNGAVRQRVQNTRGAIGYIGLGFVDRTVKALSINEVEVSVETIVSGEYPIARPLFMFSNGYPQLGSLIYLFLTFHLTPTGQEIIESIGFFPVTHY